MYRSLRDEMSITMGKQWVQEQILRGQLKLEQAKEEGPSLIDVGCMKGNVSLLLRLYGHILKKYN
jgi:hypothetical protein